MSAPDAPDAPDAPPGPAGDAALVEAAAVAEREIAAAVADALPVGVWVARAPAGEFMYANRRFQEIMGMAARDDVAAGEYAAPYGICDLEGLPYPEEKMPFVQALRAGTTITVDDIVIHRTDGARVNIRAFAKPVRDDAGTITHVIIAFIDITREVTAENARAESERRLRHAQRMEAIGNLAGGIAHDFNNLLAGLKLVAAGLKTTERDPERIASFAAIDELTDRAASLTRGLLGFAGRGRHRSTPIGLNPLVAGLAEIFRRTLVGVATIETRLEAAGDAVVLGDGAHLEQVVMNLVVNARDAIVSTGRLGRIEVATREVTIAPDARVSTGTTGESTARAAGIGPVRPGRWLVLEVSDDGPGIPTHLRERVFEPYFTTRTQGPSPGSGLGLATVFGVVEQHGGTVELDDAPGGGALVRVYLPASGVDRLALPRARPAPRTPVKGSGSLLVIDDEPLVRTGMARVMRLAGYDVTEAASGAEGIEHFRADPRRFAAIILDLVMPGLGGRATYEALRALRDDIPVLLVSGYDANDEVQALLELGVRAFLAKPCSLQELSAAVAAVIGGAPVARRPGQEDNDGRT